MEIEKCFSMSILIMEIEKLSNTYLFNLFPAVKTSRIQLM